MVIENLEHATDNIESSIDESVDDEGPWRRWNYAKSVVMKPWS